MNDPTAAGSEEVHGLPFGWIGRTAKFAEQHGVPIRAQLLAAGAASGAASITDETLIRPAEFLLMSALLINAFDDELHGITPVRMARGTASMLAKALTCERNLGGAIDTVVRFFDLIGSSCRVRLTTSDGLADLSIHADGGDLALASLIEELLAQFLHHQLSFFLGFPLPVLAFRTSARGHPSQGGKHPYLRCLVQKGSTTALIFHPRYLACGSQAKVDSSPLLDAQVFWLKHHSRQDTQTWEARSSPSSLSQKVCDFLSLQDASFADCCHSLVLNGREVQRRLLGEGTSFRKLRRSVLIRRARRPLLGGAATEDVAEALGYSDARSFRRALKSATGLTVSQLRDISSRPEPDQAEGVLREWRSQALLMT